VLPTTERAKGQGWAGFAGSLGAGLSFVSIALVEPLPGNWRWAWALGGLALLAVIPLRRRLPESQHFEAVSERGDTERARVRDLFSPRYRKRTLGALAIGFLVPMVVAGTQSWFVYYPVQHLGLEPFVATLIVLGGGGVSLVGFPLGGYLSERFGRRPTFSVTATLYVFANYAFYHVHADFPIHPALGLAPAVAGMTLLSSACAVPMRATLTELFPTALRATLSGGAAIAMALGTAVAYFASSALSAWLGGLPAAASVLGLGLPLAVAFFLFFLPETRGLELHEEDEALHRETGEK
jgi:Na+/melibiose symporter-like transporter